MTCICDPRAEFHDVDCPEFHGGEDAEITRSDIETLESLSDAAIRSGHTQTAIEGYALALRLRGETGLHPKRRASDEPST